MSITSEPAITTVTFTNCAICTDTVDLSEPHYTLDWYRDGFPAGGGPRTMHMAHVRGALHRTCAAENDVYDKLTRCAPSLTYRPMLRLAGTEVVATEFTGRRCIVGAPEGDARDWSCQALASSEELPDGTALLHDEHLTNYTEEMTRRGEKHVHSCNLIGHIPGED